MKYGILVFFLVYIVSTLFEVVIGINIPNNYQLAASIFSGAVVASINIYSKAKKV